MGLGIAGGNLLAGGVVGLVDGARKVQFFTDKRSVYLLSAPPYGGSLYT